MIVSSVEVTWWELTGLLGACIYAGSYLCAAFDRLPSQSMFYYLTKMIAAVLVLISLTHSFNLASVVIQVFFISVSLIGVARHVGQTRRQALRVPSATDAVVHIETADKNCLSRSDFG